MEKNKLPILNEQERLYFIGKSFGTNYAVLRLIYNQNPTLELCCAAIHNALEDSNQPPMTESELEFVKSQRILTVEKYLGELNPDDHSHN